MLFRTDFIIAESLAIGENINTVCVPSMQVLHCKQELPFQMTYWCTWGTIDYYLIKRFDFFCSVITFVQLGTLIEQWLGIVIYLHLLTLPVQSKWQTPKGILWWFCPFFDWTTKEEKQPATGISGNQRESVGGLPVYWDGGVPSFPWAFTQSADKGKLQNPVDLFQFGLPKHKPREMSVNAFYTYILE